jgi:hypothetical protein
MLHARYDLLADVTALGERDTMELIEERFVWKRIAEDEVAPALWDAQCNAMGVIGRFGGGG